MVKENLHTELIVAKMTLHVASLLLKSDAS